MNDEVKDRKVINKDREIFYVDVSKMTRKEAEALLKEIAEKYKKKNAPDES